MSKEVWGTFSVKDHCRQRAFVADVMLFDRLVLPVPPPPEAQRWNSRQDDDWEADPAELKRWKDNGWDPERQARLLKVLKPMARKVPWDADRQAKWKARMAGAKDVAERVPDQAFQATRMELTDGLPSYVTGVEALGVVYPSLEELEKELGITYPSRAAALPGAALWGVLAREFLVVDDPKWSDDDALRAAVDLACDPDFRQKRSNFQYWQDAYLKGGLTDRESIETAVKHLRVLLDEEQAIVRKNRWRKTARYVYRLFGPTLTLAGAVAAPVLAAAALPVAPAVALATGGLFLSVGGIAVDEKFASVSVQGQPSPVPFVHTVQKHFGWKSRRWFARK